MRLTQFAFALTIILLGFTAYLMWEGRNEARGQREQIDFLRKQVEAQKNAGAQPATFETPIKSMAPPPPGQIPPAPLPPSEAVAVAPAPVIKQPVEIPGGRPAPAALTPLQLRVMALPSIAKVKEFRKDEGFVIISAGSKQQVAKGVQFDLRRNNAVVGRITVSDIVEEAESVADLDPKSVAPGVTIEAGDEVIQVVTP